MSGPKLLDKKIINAEVATQKKQQIDTGIKIAQKVDAVRETLETETKNLDEFRTTATAQVRLEIDAIIKERDTVKDEIVIFERRKAESQIPLTIEWEQLHQAQSKFSTEKEAWGEKSQLLDQRELQIERKEQEIENDKQRAIGLTKRAAESLAEADSTLSHARETAAEIRNKAQVVLSSAEAREREVNLKEKEIEERELQVELTTKRQAQKDIEQAGHDKTIKDKYATLERTIKRLNHG